MKNYSLKNEYISIKELAKISNISQRTLRYRCSVDIYKTRTLQTKGGAFGAKYEILISSLEPELQEKISQSNNATSLMCCSTMAHSVGNIQNEPFFNEGAKKLALYKYDTVQQWQEFRKDKNNKKEADETFINAFNNGLISNVLLEKTGTVSKASLFRWQKTLKDNNYNYLSLVNNYNYVSESKLNSTLSDFEKQEFIKLYYNDAKLNIKTAYDILKFRFSKINMPIKSEATFRRFVSFIEKNHNDFNLLSREGEKALKDKAASYIRRDLSGYQVGDILVADGNKLDFMVINPFTGRPCRAIWVAFFDWISGDIAGSEIMLSENTQCISSALRNAIIRLGKIPKIVYMDNGRAFRGKYFTGCKSFAEIGISGVYESLGIKVKFAKPYSGRSKIIERFFGTFVKSCAPCVSSYIGNSIENQPAHNKRNEKFHKELHKDDKVPTLGQAKAIIETWLEYYRTKPCKHIKGKTIGEAFYEGQGKGVDIDKLDDLMMAQAIRSARRNTISIFGQEYETTALYGKTGKFIVKYSLFDISKIKIYSLKGEFIGVAQCVTYVNAMVAEKGTAIDLNTYRQEINKQKQQIKQTIGKTKQLVGASKPFNEVEWSKITRLTDKQSQIKQKDESVDCGLSLYYDIHKIQQM